MDQIIHLLSGYETFLSDKLIFPFAIKAVKQNPRQRVCSAPQDQHNIFLHVGCLSLQFQGSHKDTECGRQWSWQVYFSMEQSFSLCCDKTSGTLTIALGIAHPSDISLTSKQSSQGRVCLESLTTEGPHALQQHSWMNPVKEDTVSLSSCQHQQSLQFTRNIDISL